MEGGLGFGVGALAYAAIELGRGAMAGTSWRLNAAGAAVVTGLLFMLLSVVFEELLFRGYLFDQLTAMGGPIVALAVTSLAFGAYHLVGRPYWAIGAFFVFAMSALGGLVFGYARLRSGGLLLPIGLHWGGNWVQASLFGWDPKATTVWVADATPASLAAPDLVPHLPYLAALAVLALLVWRFPIRRRA